MKLCLDEHYAPRIAAELRARGYDVVSVSERRELMSLGDAELFAALIAEHRALLTENARDFIPLIRAAATSGETHSGVVFSSPKSMPRTRATIGRFVTGLVALLDRYPDEDGLVNTTAWI